MQINWLFRSSVVSLGGFDWIWNCSTSRDEVRGTLFAPAELGECTKRRRAEDGAKSERAELAKKETKK